MVVRFTRFAVAGFGGFILQIAMLAGLVAAGMHYVLAPLRSRSS